MSEQYTPTTDEVRHRYFMQRRREARAIGGKDLTTGDTYAEFYRWIDQVSREARTVSAEQVEDAAEAIHARSDVRGLGAGGDWTGTGEQIKEEFRGHAHAAFTAAGFIVED